MKPEACRIDYLKNHLLPKTDFEGRDSKNDREAISNYSCTSLQAIALLTLNRLPRNIVLSHQMNGHVVGCILGHELFQNITLDSNMYMRCNNCAIFIG